VDHWDYDKIRNLDPVKTLGGLAAYAIMPENLEKMAFIEFATRIAAGNCRGIRTPKPGTLHNMLVNTGRDLFLRLPKDRANGLEEAFRSQSFFLRGIEGSVNQSIDASWKRFNVHDTILREKVGFTVGNGIFFCRTLVNMIHSRTESVEPPQRKHVGQRQFHDFGYFVRPEIRITDAWSGAVKFTQRDLERVVPPAIRDRTKPFLDSVSLTLESFERDPAPLEESPLHDRPVVKVGDNYLLLFFANLFRGLSSRFQGVLINDPRYWGSYGHKKGAVLEEWTAESLRRAFPSAQIFRNIKYRSNGKEGESDIILSFGEFLLFVECTTKWIQPDSRKGVAEAIRYDLAHSVEKCYRQGNAAKDAFLAGDLVPHLSAKPSRFITMIVTDTLYPNLLLDISESPSVGGPIHGAYLKNLVKEGDFPYIVNIFDLEALATMADEKVLTQFISERIELSRLARIISYDEPDYLRLFLKPDYQLFKEAVRRSNSVLHYVGSSELPTRKSPLFLAVLNAIGSEMFAIVDLKSSAGREAKRTALDVLYSTYCNWDEAFIHLVRDEREFRTLVETHYNSGSPCRLIAWEGFWDYSRGKERPWQILRQAEKLARSLNVGALIVFSHDRAMDALMQEEIEEAEDEMKRFQEMQKFIEGL
jgi:hypothetical protein